MCSYNRVNGTYACENDKVVLAGASLGHKTEQDTSLPAAAAALPWLTCSRAD